MTRPSHVRQPGPVAKDRLQAASGWAHPFSFTVRPGRLLLEEVRDGFAAAGFSSGVARFGALGLSPFGYVMPSTSQSPRHAAYYSQTYRPQGISRTVRGALTLGTRDGAAFYHCHALWREPSGRDGGGHILPEETVVAEGGTLEAWGLSGMAFDARQDDEINFKVFGPVATTRKPLPGGRKAFALRLRPNQDYAGALEAFCRRRGINRAKISGGVGSTIGALFDDGRCIEPFVTEIFLIDGAMEPSAEGSPQARLEIGLVDMDGTVATGRLMRGENPVLMTMELVLIANEAAVSG